MENKKKFAVASLVLSLLSLAPLMVFASSMTGIQVCSCIGILLCIVGVILGIVGKDGSKKLAISGIVIGILSFTVLCFLLVGSMIIKNATDCVDNGDDTSTCKYGGQEINIPNSILSEEQKNK